MATVKDLYEGLASIEGFDRGRLRYLGREFQRAGLLPTGPQGGGEGMPQVTPDQAVTFLIAAMCPGSAREAVGWSRRMRALQFLNEDGSRGKRGQSEKLGAAFRWHVEHAVGQADTILEIATLIFDPRQPEARIITLGEYLPKDQKREFIYIEPKREVDIDRPAYSMAVTVNGRAFEVLSDILSGRGK